MSVGTAVSQAPISLPKGGGAISGIGETFQPNLFTGTGDFSVPIAASPGRNAFGPKLSLQYSTGNGNGPFGLGWQLSVPRISRKTEKGLPRYQEADVFVMSGAEDLVPLLTQDGSRLTLPDQGDYRIERFRPRTEGLFARIERWQRGNDVHWRATAKDNVTSVYGRSPTARIANPEDASQVFEWLLEETFDAKGNHILYEYAHDGAATTGAPSYDRNGKPTQAYLTRILYGNTPESLPEEKRVGVERWGTDQSRPLERKKRHYVFEVRFDYGDLPGSPPIPFNWAQTDAPASWPARDDPFSIFRAGFEIRTRRLCRRVLMLHHFKEGDLADAPLVKSTDFDYEVNPHTRLSFLSSVTVRGYRKDPQDGTRYLMREMPPVSFKYSAFEPQKQRFRSIEARGADLPPLALSYPDLTLIDLYGDGLPDVLNAGDNGYWYWRNLGEGRLDRRRAQTGGAPPVGLSDPGVAVADLGGDGLADLVVGSPPMAGFFEATPSGGWKRFKRLESMSIVNLADPDTRLVDLTGDGLSDVLVTRDSHFLWFRSKGEEGYEKPDRIPREHDLDEFPDVYFSDPAGRVRLADMTGDGLSDIVMLHDGRVDYWPNRGYGRFGPRVTMRNAPRIGQDFDPKRMFLADLEGSGCADLVYVEQNRIRFWFNQSGNAWSAEQVIRGTPRVTDLTVLQFCDFFGTGTSAVLLSYDSGSVAGGNYKVLDFCGGVKPNLLIEMDNNMGATTRAQYAPSTKFYLEDTKQGVPWVTSLPFPVQVLEKTEVIDYISRTKLVTTYKYHHGYYDGREREFRGFGRVDQYDTEEFEVFAGTGLHGEGGRFDNAAKAFHVPPVLTKQWFHTGVYFDENRTSADGSPYDKEDMMAAYRCEFYQDDHRAFVLDDHVVPRTDTPHEAYRALRGSPIRTEVYGLDGSENARHHPYTVTEHRYEVRELQPRRRNPHSVYLPLSKETVTYHYERNPEDPRIAQTLNLAFDDYGNVTETAEIAYPRRRPRVPTLDEDGNPFAGADGKPDVPLSEQRATKVFYAFHRLINKDDDRDFYYAGVPCETRRFEVHGLRWQWPAADALLPNPLMLVADAVFAELRDPDDYEPFENDPPADLTHPRKRLVDWTRSHFRGDHGPEIVDAPSVNEHRLPLCVIEPLGLPYESYQAAFDQELLDHVYGTRLDGVDLAAEGGYVQEDGIWWIPSGRQGCDAGHFYTPTVLQDPFGNRSLQQPDAYALFIESATDPLHNRVQAENDYRVLQPRLVTDANGNQTEIAFDTLGMVVGTAVMGKPEDRPRQGDRLDGPFLPDPAQVQIDAFLGEPRHASADPNASEATQAAHDLLGRATTRIVYDLTRYIRLGEPPLAATIARETHVSDLGPNQRSELQISFSYSDGLGREIQKKIQAEPGPVVEGQPLISPRWVGSGWTIFNNKGKPVRQYEPFFSATHSFERDVTAGVSPALFYDAAKRVIATLHPNHTYDKVVFDPWQQTTYDANDTCAACNAQTGDPRTDPDIGGHVADYFETQPATWQTWHAQRIAGALGQNEQATASRAAAHADTPTTAHLDSLGRPFLTVARNRVVCPGHDLDETEERFDTRIQLDIEGNQREVRDAIRQAGDPLGRIVMRYAYDMLGNRIHQLSMEAGARWMLNDVAGKPIRAWDSRGHRFTTRYDALRRPVKQIVRGTSPESDPRTLNHDILVDKIEYGEGVANAEALNFRTRIYRDFDCAGVATNARLDANGTPIEAYDFKGNLLRSTRRLVSDYRTVPDWGLNPQLETETFAASIRYDALNRPIQSIAPHSSLVRADHPNRISVIQPVFNEANLLERVDVWLERAAEPAALLDPNTEAPSPVGVANIDYDAKGQRLRIDYKNGASTFYDYDPHTFRLTQLLTQRNTAAFPGDDPQPPIVGWPGRQVQNLHYTYDPIGNITHIQDDAQQAIYFRNKRVEPSNDYTYDALYRLIQATGREHLGQGNGAPNAPTAPDAFNGLHARLEHPGDGNAMGTYVERYVYDAVGNFVQMQHRGGDPAHAGWTRAYDYTETSLIEDGSGAALSKTSNRLARTRLNRAGNTPQAETYLHDNHGNMVRMPHLGGGPPGHNMHWDYKDQLRQTDLGGGGAAYYIYDASGQRVRKVWEKAPGLTEERIYLGGFEIFRRHKGPIGANTAVLERETLHVMDDKQRTALVETRTLDTADDDKAPERLIRIQFGNHLGSTSLELDEQAQIVSYEEYAPYGSTTYQAVHSLTETPKPYRYSGKERDEESGLYYFGVRYYAAWLGRWTGCDPVTFTNRYSYVALNPIARVDPDGRQPTEPSTGSNVAPTSGSYSQVRGDHVHQVASRTSGPGAPRTSAPQFRSARAISTHSPGYNDAGGQRVETAINRAQWGENINGSPARSARVTVRATGETSVGTTQAAQPSPWFEDSKSYYKLREAGLSSDDALKEVWQSADQLEKAGATPERVPNAPRSTPHALKQGQILSQETPIRTSGQSASKAPASTTAEVVSVTKNGGPSSAVPKVGLGGRILRGLGKIAAVGGALAGGVQVGTGIKKILDGKVGEGAIDVGEGSANLGLSIGTTAGVEGGAVAAEAGLAAGTLAVGAGLAASGSVLLLAETARSAVKGEETPIDIADKFYGTHFGDLYGWVTGAYAGG